MEQADILFGQIAVGMKLLTKEQLRQCLAAQQRRPGQRLGEVCLALGLLQLDGIQRILEHQARRRAQMVVIEKPARPPAESVEVSIDLSQVSARESPAPQSRHSPPSPTARPRSPAADSADVMIDLSAQTSELVVEPLGSVSKPLVSKPLVAQPAAAPPVEQRPSWLEQERPSAPRLAAAGPEGRPAWLEDTRAAAPDPIRVVEPQRGRLRPAPAAPSVAEPPSVEPLADPPTGTGDRINDLLRRMVEKGASDLHLSAGNAPLIRLHGSIAPLDEHGATFDAATLREVLYEILPARIRAEFETTRDADFAHAIHGLARFRINYFVDHKGIGAVFRQIPYQILTPAQIGLPRRVLDLCLLSKGLVLVTGPTGSGKSTTLATMIDHINETRELHIITIEDPIEFVHPNKKCLVNQREVGAHTQSFKRALRAALREDPDIVLVGEMRDLETVAIALETAETGHLVFGTLHTTSAASTVDRVIDQFPADQQAQIRTMLGESLRGVVAQMLCRRRGGGRVAAYEVLLSTPALSNLIREGKTHQIPSVMQTSKELGMQLLNDNLLELVRAGTVDPREAYLLSYDKPTLKANLARLGVALNI